jgi:hypothetical protein
MAGASGLFVRYAGDDPEMGYGSLRRIAVVVDGGALARASRTPAHGSVATGPAGDARKPLKRTIYAAANGVAVLSPTKMDNSDGKDVLSGELSARLERSQVWTRARDASEPTEARRR